MRYLRWNETLFREPEVFDPEYLPEEYLFRETQLNRLSTNMKPAAKNSRPMNTLCLGPPGTGKTTAVKLIFKEMEEELENIIPVHINCQIITSKQQIFAKVFEKVHGYALPSYGTPFSKVYYNIMDKLVEGQKVLIIALDDLNFLLDDHIINETLYAFLRAHEEVEGAKIGVIGIATDLKLTARLDERTGSVFHPDEIYFPPYGKEEIMDILDSRAKFGFYQGVLQPEALEKIVDLTYEGADLRLGLHLLKMSGLEAERRASTKVELEDVENASESGKKVFLRKMVQALRENERTLLERIYSGEETTSGELFNKMKDELNMGYTKFYEMIHKLESIKLIDTAFDKKKRGRTRTIVKRYDPQMVLDALKEY